MAFAVPHRLRIVAASISACASILSLHARDAHADPAPGRVQLDVTAGVVMPTEVTPKQVDPTHTGVGPIVRAEVGWAVTPSIEIGPYVSYSSHPVKTIDGFPSYDGSGSVSIFSGGGAIKYRFAPAPWLTLRAGATIGVNAVNAFIANAGGGGESMPGSGLQLGALLDARFQVAQGAGVLVQLGFLSQPTGSAKFPNDTDRAGEHVDLAIPPTFFFTVGPELWFGQ